MFDKFNDECAIFGIAGHPEAANLAYLGLYAMQHRGQESAGIAAADGTRVVVSKDDGPRRRHLQLRPSGHADGRRRRSATRAIRPPARAGSTNAQPILIDCAHGQIAIAHNGNLVNAQELRDDLVRHGSIFQTSSDTEVILHLYARSRAGTIEDAIVESVSAGARRVLARDAHERPADRGPRPARVPAAGARQTGRRVGRLLRDLRARSHRRDLRARRRARRGGRHRPPTACGRSGRSRPSALAHCVFEHVYFSRPDSYVFGKSVNEVRTNMGRILAREAPIDADVVVPIPDSGVCAAVGYAEAAGIPMRMGLIRNHYVGRTFIQPQQSIRHFGVRVKLNPVRSILEGKRVILVDDSIVRGTTSRKIVRMVKAAGAKEVHMRISCPPTISPCFYGVDTPQALRADCRDAHARGDPPVSRCRDVELPESRRHARGRRRGPRSRTARRATPAGIRSSSRATSRRTCS